MHLANNEMSRYRSQQNKRNSRAVKGIGRGIIVEGGEKGEGRKEGRHKEERERRKKVVIFSNLHTLSPPQSVLSFRASDTEMQRNTEGSTFFPFLSSPLLRCSLCIPPFVLVLLTPCSGHKSQLTLYVFPSLSECSHQMEREREKVKHRE